MTAVRIYRKDYRAPEYTVKSAKLDFNLYAYATTVKSVLTIVRECDSAGDLILNGDEIELVSVALNGKPLIFLEDYFKDVPNEPHSIRILRSLIANLPTFDVQIENKNFPHKNTALMGLYKSNKLLVTHNEPQGFRRITYYIDRPDNMATFEVRLEADKIHYPTLLCNGDEIRKEDLGNRHASTFVDPFPKGAHLFAIVAGPLSSVHTTFTTCEGQSVDVYVLAEEAYKEQLDWALQATVRSMKWDEETFGRVYDLKTFRVVGVSDFNMGAMENKSLTIFNIAAVVALPDRTNDAMYNRVVTVICHEYFHNWSGNRVNVRDWFQITLKEGFTAYREQSFMCDFYGENTERIKAVKSLKTRQFPEDAGSTCHCIRPESYVEVDNFYTPTVYQKGSEVIRMMRVIVGKEGFRRGCDLYFSKYDGKAISCDEFRGAIAEANGRDFSQFERWYTQRGTPVVAVQRREWDTQNQRYSITLKQILPANTNEFGEPGMMHIPVVVGLIGKESKVDLVPETVLELTQEEQTFEIPNVKEDCVPSLLRGFSAPVILKSGLSENELAFLMTYDSDAYNRWDASQTIIGDYILDRAAEVSDGSNLSDVSLPDSLKSAFEHYLQRSENVDEAMLALSLTLPDSISLCGKKPGSDPYRVWQATKALEQTLSKTFYASMLERFNQLNVASEPFSALPAAVGKRALKNVLLDYIVAVPGDGQKEARQIAYQYYKTSSCFNDAQRSVAALTRLGGPEAEEALDQFYKRCKGVDETCLDQYFLTFVSASQNANSLDQVKQCALTHPDYKDSTNPNRMRSLITPMVANPAVFHHPSGDGYTFLAETIMRWDTFNSHLAAVAAKALANQALYDHGTQLRMKKACKVIMDSGRCSTQLAEVVSVAAN